MLMLVKKWEDWVQKWHNLALSALQQDAQRAYGHLHQDLEETGSGQPWIIGQTQEAISRVAHNALETLEQDQQNIAVKLWAYSHTP